MAPTGKSYVIRFRVNTTVVNVELSSIDFDGGEIRNANYNCMQHCRSLTSKRVTSEHFEVHSRKTPSSSETRRLTDTTLICIC